MRYLRCPIRRSRQNDPCRVKIRILNRIGTLIGMGHLFKKMNTFEGRHLIERGAYWKECAKTNQEGKIIFFLF